MVGCREPGMRGQTEFLGGVERTMVGAPLGLDSTRAAERRAAEGRFFASVRRRLVRILRTCGAEARETARGWRREREAYGRQVGGAYCFERDRLGRNIACRRRGRRASAIRGRKHEHSSRGGASQPTSANKTPRSHLPSQVSLHLVAIAEKPRTYHATCHTRTGRPQRQDRSYQ